MATTDILVVDDEDTIRSMLRLVLESEGFRVATAANGKQALDRIAQERPGVVLLDLQMPVMNGWELQDRLREEQPQVPVVFMTAGMRAKVEAERHHAAGYLAKPFDVDELIRVVSSFAVPR